MYFGARPIICLKDTATLKKLSDNNYQLVGPENTDNYITAENLTTEDYGGYVTNYKASTASDSSLGIYGWRIFHTDGNNIYLISDNYINPSYIPNGQWGTEARKSYSGVDNTNTYWSNTYYNRIFTLNPYRDYITNQDVSSVISSKWLKQYTTTSTNINARATAYLLDQNVWSGFKDKNGYADYAVGGPTLELYAESYNATHDKKIELETNHTGYKIRWNENSDYAYEINGLNTNEDLYVQNYKEEWRYWDTGRVGTWIASPSSSTVVNMMCITFDGKISYVSYDYMNDSSYSHYEKGAFGARPIICLKSDVKLEKIGYKSYAIVD